MTSSISPVSSAAAATTSALQATTSALQANTSAVPATTSALPGTESNDLHQPLRESRFAVGARMVGVLVSHAATDYYTAFVPAALIFLEGRCRMTSAESAWLLGAGSLISGVSQPLSAWLGDRYQSRVAAPLGLLFVAVALSLIGTATNFGALFAVYFVSMLGAGMYHPVAAASSGDLAGRHRNLGVSGFFIAGMLGQTMGGLGASQMARRMESIGFLWEACVTGLLVAGFCWWSLPRPRSARQADRLSEPADAKPIPFLPVAILYICAAMRFTVNMSILYLYGRWAERMAADLPLSSLEPRVAAAGITGAMQAATTIGMAFGGLASGLLVRGGREKWPLVWVPIFSAPTIWLLPQSEGMTRYTLAALAGFGFAAMIPVGITVMQRLLPRNVAFASGLMLGGAWSIAVIGPPWADWMLHHWGMESAFRCTAGLLALSGLLLIPVRLETRYPKPSPL